MEEIIAQYISHKCLASLLTVWIFRENPIGGYITPVLTMLISIFLMFGCIKRIKAAIDEITDKTLPEDVQLKILSVINQFYHRYSEFHPVNSRKSGGHLMIDLHVSFDDQTTFEEIISLKEEVQDKISELFDGGVVNIILQDGREIGILEDGRG